MTGLGADLPSFGWHAKLTPFVLTAATFTLLYIVMPNARVRWTHALAGAVFAAALFEVLKLGFAVFVDNVPTHRTLYGALAAVPVFLIWMYLTWTVILIGAVVAAAWPEWNAERQGTRGVAVNAPARLWLSLAVVRDLLAAAQAGEPRDRAALLSHLNVDSADLRAVLALLHDAHYVAHTDDSDVWFLVRDMGSTSLCDLYRAIGQGAAASGGIPRVFADQPWAETIGGLLGEVNQHHRASMATSLKTLLVPDAGAEDAAAPWPRPVESRVKSETADGP